MSPCMTLSGNTLRNLCGNILGLAVLDVDPRLVDMMEGRKVFRRRSFHIGHVLEQCICSSSKRPRGEDIRSSIPSESRHRVRKELPEKVRRDMGRFVSWDDGKSAPESHRTAKPGGRPS